MSNTPDTQKVFDWFRSRNSERMSSLVGINRVEARMEQMERERDEARAAWLDTFGRCNLCEQQLDEARAEVDQLFKTTSKAIQILDGNIDRIDWTDQTQPELLRKLCEHLLAYDETRVEADKGWDEWASMRDARDQLRDKVAELKCYLDASHYKTCNAELRAEVARLREALEKAKTSLRLIADEGGTTNDTECGPLRCDGYWCADQARWALYGLESANG